MDRFRACVNQLFSGRAAGRLRGEQPGRENNSSRLPVCHEPNLRLTSSFVVLLGAWVRWMAHFLTGVLSP